MDMTAIIVALISLLGTAGGAITGVIVSNKLSTYRIEQLENKVEGLNQTIKDFMNNVNELRERLIIAEQSAKSAHHRLDDIVSQLKITERRK